VTEDGLPFLGQVPDVSGAYIATGHGCRGILNAPASGLAMAELIVDGQAHSVDLTPYAPQRALPQGLLRPL
jgi:glycine/D-amino acid oxidase-like deaminating enzyme